MRKKIFCLFLCFAMLAGLFAGCGTKVNYEEHLGDYVKTMDYRDGFTVLQLTDIHWSNGTQIGNDQYGQIAYLTKVIEEAKRHAGKIDLIEVTGDTFMLANKAAVKAFIDFMTETGIPYAMVWGNHDRQAEYNPNWISKQFRNAPNCLYTEVDGDNVHERCNYVINLMDGDKDVWQIAHLDSGASFRQGAGDLGLDYDYIRQDQLDWLRAEHQAAGEDVPVLCYYHICQADNQAAYDAIAGGADGYKSKFFYLESFGESGFAPKTEDFFREIHVKGAFAGHAHATDWTYTTPDGIVFGLGVKTGLELYRGVAEPGNKEAGFEVPETFDISGASLVTVTDREGNFALEHLSLNERDGGDFVLWVTY